jgi:hypothetical protein
MPVFPYEVRTLLPQLIKSGWKSKHIIFLQIPKDSNLFILSSESETDRNLPQIPKDSNPHILLNLVCPCSPGSELQVPTPPRYGIASHSCPIAAALPSLPKFLEWKEL